MSRYFLLICSTLCHFLLGGFTLGYRIATFRYAQMVPVIVCNSALRYPFFQGSLRLGYKGATFRYAHIFSAILCYVALRCAVFSWVFFMLGYTSATLRYATMLSAILSYAALRCAFCFHVLLVWAINCCVVSC